MSLRRDVGQLVESLNQYVLGIATLSPEVRESAARHLGNIGADIVLLSRTLKVKTPSLTKKSKLKSSITAALLEMDGYANDLLAVSADSLFAVPATKNVTKEVVLPAKGGAKEMREVAVIDAEVETSREAERRSVEKTLLENIIVVYWPLCYAITGKTPVALLEEKMGRVAAANPDLKFEDVMVEKEEEVVAA
jgi:hypothetical protein